MNKIVLKFCGLTACLFFFAASSCRRSPNPAADATASLAPMPRKILYYRNPMDPSITSPEPMKDSMGMAYIPVDATESASSVPVAGQAVVHLSQDMEQRIGVRVAAVVRRDFMIPIRSAARVAYDPLLYSAALEHQEAMKFLRLSSQGGSAENLEQAKATVRSSELRLRQMGLSDGQIQEIEKPAYDPSDLLVGSEGGSVWIYADVLDYQAPLIHPGQRVELTSQALPGKTYAGTVRAIDPIMNSDTRTVRVRVRVANASEDLRPGVFLNALIHASIGRVLTVPESAVMDTGARQWVYVQTQPGVYEPRPVRIGQQTEGEDQIIEGLKEGETVAISANFLIDSESRIEAAAQAARH